MSTPHHTKTRKTCMSVQFHFSTQGQCAIQLIQAIFFFKAVLVQQLPVCKINTILLHLKQSPLVFQKLLSLIMFLCSLLMQESQTGFFLEILCSLLKAHLHLTFIIIMLSFLLCSRLFLTLSLLLTQRICSVCMRQVAVFTFLSPLDLFCIRYVCVLQIR